MSLVDQWQALVRMARENGLASRVLAVPENPKTPGYGSKLRRGEPSEQDLAPWLPEEYRSFITRVGYAAIDFGEGARLAFLPPRVMRQVTGAMGDPQKPFDEVRRLREQGAYTWPFTFFAGWDLADVNGWCFAASIKRTGEPSVWLVEDSLPVKALGSFESWLEKEIARISIRP